MLGVALLLFWLYHRYWKRILREKKDRLAESREMYGEDVGFSDDDDDDSDDDSVSDHDASEDEMNDAVAELPHKSSDARSSTRNSTVTTHTKASNILPIAYIPGVTSRPPGATRLGNSDVRSHITLGSSILGPDDSSMHSPAVSNTNSNVNLNTTSATIPNTDAAPDANAPANAEKNADGEPRDLTTAIRAKPKLVQIEETPEGEEAHSTYSQIPHEGRWEYEQEQYQDQDQQSDAGSGSFVLDVAGPEPPTRMEESRPTSPFEDPQ